jgi:catechol 2,3-dioxygenase-like lactoylglutathione lyase family enzyme
MVSGVLRSRRFAVHSAPLVLLGVLALASGGFRSETSPPVARSAGPHFHHVHLNVTDVSATLGYYEKYFGALPIRYRDRAAALFTERSFLLLDPVEAPPADNFGTALWHIGWAGVHGPTEFEWRVNEGIDVQTPITPLGRQHYMYFWGPDRELVEVYTGSRNHRFEHVHLLATDIEETIDWFKRHFDLEPTGPVRVIGGTTVRVNTIRIDNVNLIVFEAATPEQSDEPLLPAPVEGGFAVTDGRAMDHFAFSYAEIQPVFDRLVAAGVQIVRPIATDPLHGLTSFFIRGPDGVLIEIVEELPLPEGIWQ